MRHIKERKLNTGNIKQSESHTQKKYEGIFNEIKKQTLTERKHNEITSTEN